MERKKILIIVSFVIVILGGIISFYYGGIRKLSPVASASLSEEMIKEYHPKIVFDKLSLFLLTFWPTHEVRAFFSRPSNDTTPSGQLLTTFYVKGTPTEIKGVSHNAQVVPTVGEQGVVVVKGSGSVTLSPFINDQGILFTKPGQQNKDTGYLSFKMNGVSSTLNPFDGEISFIIKSKYSFIERAAIPQYNYRYIFDIFNGTIHPYYFIVHTTSGANAQLVFTYATASSKANYYYVPAGKGEEVFGKDKLLRVKMVWKDGKNFLYLNDVMVKSDSYVPFDNTWTSQSELSLGSQRGYFTSDDSLADFKISLRSSQSYSVASSTGAATQTSTTFQQVQPVISGSSTIVSSNSTSSKGVGVIAVSSTPKQNSSVQVTPTMTGNSITIKNKSDVIVTKYPVQVGRPFLRGEIKKYPQAVVNGVPVLTQADIKQRWPDGSVKHAVISFVLETLPKEGEGVVAFVDQATMNNTALTPTEMLSSYYDFDAVIDLGVAGSVSAREMIKKGDYMVWNSGPINTSIVARDNSVERKFDMGADNKKSVRPGFEITFWKTLGKVSVRYIGEISNTEFFQDQTYDLTLKMGNTAQKVVYSKNNLLHTAGSRWTKVYWIGGEPEKKININHNLSYIKETKFLPNYDTSIVIPEAQIASDYTKWLSKPKDLYDAGLWQKAMATTGGRPDIGPYPSWTVQWFYTGDWRSKEIAFSNSDLAGAWPMHFREGDPKKYFDENKTVFGLGKPVSIKDRPSLFLGSSNWYMQSHMNKKEDAIKVVGPYNQKSNGWLYDDSHTPEAFSPQYLLSGEYWYLEQMEFWSSALSANSGSGITVSWGRGLTGREGGITTQTRGEGWIFRSRVELANLESDYRPEKVYWNAMIDDAIAIWEGARNITGTSYVNTPNWKWGNTVGKGKFTTYGFPVAPIYSWGGATGGAYINQPFMKQPITMKGAIAPWMQNMVIYGLGRGRELGFKTDALLAFVGGSIVGQLTSKDYNPYMSSLYVLPTISKDNQWFTRWKDIQETMSDTYDYKKAFQNSLGDTEHGYANIARVASAMTTHLPQGKEAWMWMSSQTDNTYFTKNPKWAILPR